MNPYYAYIHAKPDGTPFYVGKGRGKRATEFRRRSEYHMRLVAKHGAENILVGKVECSSEAIAFDLERGLIKCLRRSGVKLVNHTDGGEGWSGGVHSDEARAKMKAKATGRVMPPEAVEKMRQALVGRSRSSDSVAKMIATNTGTKRSPEARAKMSAAAKVRGILQTTLDAAHAAQIGRKASKETRAKMSASRRGRVDSDETRAKKSAAAKARPPKSEAHRAAIGAAFKGRVLTEEHRAKLSEASRATWARRKGEIA